MGQEKVRLYHGSNTAIERPRIALNTGFADLGKGFYLTTDHEAALGRAKKRARDAGGTATVSVFELDESCVPWIAWGANKDALVAADTPFGLRFEKSSAGYAAWASYIKACRCGQAEVPGIGAPAIVRAWIATMEVEMVCSGFLTAEELAQATDPAELIVQYCILDQDILNNDLALVGTETLVI